MAQGYSWWAIRLMATSGEGGAGTLKGGNLSDVIYSFIVSPLIYLIVPTIISEILEGHKRRNSIILSIVQRFCILLQLFLGQFGLLQLYMYFVHLY